MTYRIVQVITDKKTWFEVEEKKWLFFWVKVKKIIVELGVPGDFMKEVPFRFDTLQEAEGLIQAITNSKKNRKAVKHGE